MENSIKNYIESKIPELANRLFPVFTTDLSNTCVSYTYVPISGGHVKQSQLELKIIDSDYDKCKGIEVALCNLLDFEEDAPFETLDTVRFYSRLSGGGTLFNNEIQMYEVTQYFVLKWRKRNV